MNSNDSSLSSAGKENDSLSAMFGYSPSKMTPQRAEKIQASEARAKVLKERAQEAERSYDADGERRRSALFVTEEQIRLSVEKDIRRSRDGQKSPGKKIENRRLSSSTSPHVKYDTTHETSWSQFLKWVPLTPAAPSSSTLLDNEGYAVPNTRGYFSQQNLRTPERIKSPDEMFFTPAGNFNGRESSPYTRGNSSPGNDTLIKHLQEDFQRKLSLESTKIGLMTRKTIQGLEEVEKLIADDQEKSWKSPLKKCNLQMPEFSGVRQSHPLTKDHAEFRSSLPGAATIYSDDEATLDDVSPLNSEADPAPKRSTTGTKTSVEPSKLPKILGSQLQAEINYVETSNRLSEKLDQVEELLNSSKRAAPQEADISRMLDGIELFDHSLPHYSLTPKQRYQKGTKETSAPTPPRSATKQKSVSFRGVDRTHAYQEYCKALADWLEYMKRHIEQQKKVHELVKEPSIYNESYQRVVENYYADMKTQIQEKKREAKENSENNRISDEDFMAWIKQEKKFIDNQTKFFAFIFTDLGKFIQKYDVQAPPPVHLPPRPRAVSSIAHESYEDHSSTQGSTGWKVTVDIESTSKSHWAPETYSSPLKMLSTPEKEATNAAVSHNSDYQPDQKLWEISLREPETPSALDQAFVGLNPTPVKEADIWDQSAKELPSGVFSNSERSSLSDPFELPVEAEKQEEIVEEKDEEPAEEANMLEESSSNLSSPVIQETLPYQKPSEIPVVKVEVPEIVPKLVGLVSESSSSSENREESSSSLSDDEPPSSTMTPWTPRSPRGHPAVPPLELSLLHSSGRVSIDASGLFDDEEDIDDFLNRSGRKEPAARYKLSDSLLLDSTSVEGEQPVKTSPQKEYVNEPYPKSPQPSPQPPIDSHKNQLQFNISDLNLTEEEGLEDVKKPDPVFDFTISTEVNEYENRLATEEDKWEKFVNSIEKSEGRIEMINDCIEIVWKVKEEHGFVPEEELDNWRAFVQKYPADKLFEDSEKQEMYNSEWIAMLGDVFEIAGDLYPKEQPTNYKPIYYPLPSFNLDKEKFTEICREHLIEKKRTSLVEDTTKEYVWDMDPARRNAHEMICEVHNVYLREELCGAVEVEIKRGICETSDLYLQKTVESVLKESRAYE